jgi:hypothetical protein
LSRTTASTRRCGSISAEGLRADVIKWAWDKNACLVEAHSHRAGSLASFSPSDIWGLDEWVPRIWWRLRGRPYAAIVFAGQSFDALAWIDHAQAIEQVERIVVDGEITRATALTLRHLAELRERANGG